MLRTLNAQCALEPWNQGAADVPSAEPSQTCRQDAGSTIRCMGSLHCFTTAHRDHEPTPNPSEEGSRTSRPIQQFPSPPSRPVKEPRRRRGEQLGWTRCPFLKHTRRSRGRGWNDRSQGDDFPDRGHSGRSVWERPRRRNSPVARGGFEPLRPGKPWSAFGAGSREQSRHGTCGVTTRYHRYALEPAAGSAS